MLAVACSGWQPVLAACKTLARNADAYVDGEAAQMVEHVIGQRVLFNSTSARAARYARCRDDIASQTRLPCAAGCLSGAPAAARRVFTMEKRKHKDSTARYVTPQCLIISSQQWQRAPAPTPRRRPAVLLGSRRCDVRRGARLLAGFRWRVTRDLHEVCCILRPRWSLRLDTRRRSFEPSTGKRRCPFRVFGLVHILWSCFAGQLPPWKMDHKS